MPLLQPVLAQALIALDEPQPPTSPAETAEAWFKAWWTYAQQMTFWLPGPTLLLAEAAARPVFVAALLPACIPNPVPGIFYLALEVAQVTAWATSGAVPGALLPAYIPGVLPLLVPPFVPGVLSAALVATVPIGFASPTKDPVRIAMATAIALWTPLSFGVTLLAGPPQVPIL